MAFWSSYDIRADGKGFEPRRKHTFLLSIAGKGLSLENYLIKKVKKPSFKISESKTKFLNHTFYYPGSVEWEPVTFTVVDVINPNTTQKFLELLEQCGYRAPAGPVSEGNANAQTISKLRSVEAIGIPIIRQIDADGRTVDEWRLKGAWIQDVNFGELDYDAEDLMAIDVSLRYDYAFCTIIQPGSKKLPSNA